MAHYCIYPLNPAGRIIGIGVDVICANDLAARRYAKYMLACSGRVEVWSGTRYVGEVAIGQPKAIEVTGRRGRELPQHATARATAPATAAAPSWGRADLFAAAEISVSEELDLVEDDPTFVPLCIGIATRD